MTEELIDKLKKLANSDCFYDDDNEPIVDDYAGGNVDDAFGVGEHSGEVMLARMILKDVGIDWNN